jgi:hypothetical protein
MEMSVPTFAGGGWAAKKLTLKQIYILITVIAFSTFSVNYGTS